jgi:hypothetical protein
VTSAANSAVQVLALSALAFAVLMPPEAYPAGKAGVVLCSTFAFLAAAGERRIPSRFLTGGVVIFSLLLLHSFVVSVDAYRSLDFLAMFWAYYCLVGFFMYAAHDSVTGFAWVMVLLAAVVSAYGIYQYFWGFDELRSYVVYSVSGQARRIPFSTGLPTGACFPCSRCLERYGDFCWPPCRRMRSCGDIIARSTRRSRRAFSCCSRPAS